MNYLVLSAHDYRTPRRASIHFLADELAKRGNVRFFSLRYSALSKLKGDIRVALDSRANRVESHAGVECYLWKAHAHPFNTRRTILRPVENLAYRAYAATPPAVLRRWIKDANVIIFESGTAITFVSLAKRLNPTAKLIYRASDDLQAIEVATFVEDEFRRVFDQFDAVCLVSPRMVKGMPSTRNTYFVPHGIEIGFGSQADPSPYKPGKHAVSVGSMLFDPWAIKIASHAFPDVTFHVIGSGLPHQPGYGTNVVVYDHMAFKDVLPYIKHATIGMAPYTSEAVPDYLADSSLKLLQYDFFSLPSVCPKSVTGDYSNRFGYEPGDRQSLVRAISEALPSDHVRTRHIMYWNEVVDRLLAPAAYPDTSYATSCRPFPSVMKS